MFSESFPMLTAEQLFKRTRDAAAAGTLPPSAPIPVQVEQRPLPPAEQVCLHLGEDRGGSCGARRYWCQKRTGITTLWNKCDEADFHCPTCSQDTRRENPPRSKPLPRPLAVVSAAPVPAQTPAVKAVPAAPPNGFAAPPVRNYGPVGERHLAFHVLPVGVNGCWRRAVDQLKARWSLFTGRKVFAVATGDDVFEQIDPNEGDGPAARILPLDSPETVRAYLPPDAEVFAVPNERNKWESASWPELFGRVLSGAADRDAIFYGHAKGVTRRVYSPVHKWADALYRLNLDFWPQVEELLRRYPIVGSLTRFGRFFGAPCVASRWHYSGNFWWARADHFRAAYGVIPVPQDRWGAEAWPGIAFTEQDCGTLFRPKDDFHLYKIADLVRLEAELSSFLFSQRPSFSFPAKEEKAPLEAKRKANSYRLSVIVSASGRPSLARTLESVSGQLDAEAGDEIIVVSDKSNDFGATPRTDGMRRAAGDYLLWMDDDDIYLPGALAAVRAALRRNPNRPHIFGMWRDAKFGDQLPRWESAELGNVSTQMFVTPNDPAKLGTWGKGYTGDYEFIRSTLAKYPAGAVAFRPEVISCWRPNHEANEPPRWWSHEAGSYDRFAWLEVVHRDDYRARSRPLVGGVCVDVGAHVGSFAYLAKSRGALAVHCYEPQPVNFSHLERNAAGMPGVVPFPSALGSIVKDMMQAGRPAPDEYDSTDLNAAVDRAAAVAPNGRVAFLKMDAEGCEWEAFAGFRRWDLVDYIAGEWHTLPADKTRRRVQTAADAMALLSDTFSRAGWEVEFGPPTDSIGLFHARPRSS